MGMKTIRSVLTEADIHAMIFELLGQIAPEAADEDLDFDDDIRFELDIDSFDFLNFLIGLNERTGVDIPEADYGRLVSVNDITGYILTRLG